MVACALEGASEARTEHFDRPSGTDAPLCIISQHFVLGFYEAQFVKTQRQKKVS
jgi:hypothetical protein